MTWNLTPLAVRYPTTAFHETQDVIARVCEYLPPRKIVENTLVSKTWKKAIEGNKETCQSAYFFKEIVKHTFKANISFHVNTEPLFYKTYFPSFDKILQTVGLCPPTRYASISSDKQVAVYQVKDDLFFAPIQQVVKQGERLGILKSSRIYDDSLRMDFLSISFVSPYSDKIDCKLMEKIKVVADEAVNHFNNIVVIKKPSHIINKLYYHTLSDISQDETTPRFAAFAKEQIPNWKWYRKDDFINDWQKLKYQ